MDYPLAAFDALIDEVEAQGGALLPEPCMPEEIIFKSPQKQIPDSYTQGCTHESRLVSTYDPDLDHREGGAGFATTCGVCDSMGAWPRYSEAVYAVAPDLNITHRRLEDE